MSINWGFKITKPICFILFGHSLEEFENRIQEFKDLDVAWMSLNWQELADRILKKIDKKIDYHVWYEGANGNPHATAYRFKASEARGCSLYEAILQFAENDVKEAYLFGADGFKTEGKTCPYYGYEQVFGGYAHNGHERHSGDLEHFNNNYPPDIVEKSGLQVYNTSQISRYNIPKITLDECITRLKRQANTSLKAP